MKDSAIPEQPGEGELDRIPRKREEGGRRREEGGGRREEGCEIPN